MQAGLEQLAAGLTRDQKVLQDKRRQLEEGRSAHEAGKVFPSTLSLTLTSNPSP